VTWGFFDRVVCLTNDAAEWCRGRDEFARVGLDAQRFNALDDIGPHQSFSRSVRQILIDFHESGDKTLLHLEDDCVFRELYHLGEALNELPDNWDIVYLGANIQGDVLQISPHLFKVSNAWTTHCIGFNRKVIPFILENQPGFSEMMLDNWLGSQLGKLNAYVVAPMVAWQRPRYSTIWGRLVDYNEVFEASEAKLA
jgi:hypothetical protein